MNPRIAMSTSPSPGPAYELQAGEGNRIVEASHYITTFIIALIVQDYIRNGLQLFARGVGPAVIALLAVGLLTLLTFALESYLTATGRSDSLRREDLRYEIVRALFSLLGLLGLHNFSLILIRIPADGITTGAIASQFGWGLVVVYVGYLGIRVVVARQNQVLGKDPDERTKKAAGMYAVYALVWIGFAEVASGLTGWIVTLAFLSVIIITFFAYFRLWRDRYEKLIGVYSDREHIEISSEQTEFSDVESIRYEQETESGRNVKIHATRPSEGKQVEHNIPEDSWLVDVTIDGDPVEKGLFTSETVGDIEESVNKLINDSVGP